VMWHTNSTDQSATPSGNGQLTHSSSNSPAASRARPVRIFGDGCHVGSDAAPSAAGWTIPSGVQRLRRVAVTWRAERRNTSNKKRGDFLPPPPHRRFGDGDVQVIFNPANNPSTKARSGHQTRTRVSLHGRRIRVPTKWFFRIISTPKTAPRS
jgi:hypothetical protein